MSELFALKLLTDLCYYMFSVSSLTSCAPHSGLLLTSPLFVALSGFLTAYVSSRRPKRNVWKLLPLLVCGGAFFFTKTTMDKVVTVPMIVYLAFLAFRNRMIVDYDSTLSRFFLCLKLLPVPALLTVIAGNKDGFLSVMLPYFLFFLILTVMLLRLLRHNEKVFRDKRFRIVNFLEIAALCGFGWLLSTGIILRFFKWIAGLIAMYVFRPVLTGVVYLFGGFAWLLNKLFSGIDFHMEDVDLSQLQIGQPMDASDKAILDYYQENAGTSTAAHVVTYVLIALAVLVTIALLILLFRILMKAGRREEDNHFSDVRESLTQTREGGGNRLGHSPRDRVRHYYRRFLKRAEKAGLDPDEHYDTREIASLVRRLFRPEALDGLREVYIRARYSTEEITADDVSRAKEMVEQLKEEANK